MSHKQKRELHFTEPTATILEEKRNAARKGKRLTFDCYNNFVEGDKVFCRKLYPLAGIGHMGLVSVLRGTSASVCQACESYDDGGEPWG